MQFCFPINKDINASCLLRRLCVNGPGGLRQARNRPPTCTVSVFTSVVETVLDVQQGLIDSGYRTVLREATCAECPSAKTS